MRAYAVVLSLDEQEETVHAFMYKVKRGGEIISQSYIVRKKSENGKERKPWIMWMNIGNYENMCRRKKDRKKGKKDRA